MAKASSRGDDVDQVTLVNTTARFIRLPRQEVPPRFESVPLQQRKMIVQKLELKPGAQRVDREVWMHEHVQHSARKLLEDQVIRVLEKPIHSLSETAAVKLVRMTIDRPILLGAQAKEKREKVKKAIARQLREIEKVAHKPAA